MIYCFSILSIYFFLLDKNDFLLYICRETEGLMENFANFIKDNTSLFSADVIEKAEQFYALQNPQQLKQLNLQIRKNMYQMDK